MVKALHLTGLPALKGLESLVTFEPGARVGFLTLARMQRELAELLGRKVDLVPKGGLKPVIRDSVLATARVLYAA